MNETLAVITTTVPSKDIPGTQVCMACHFGQKN
jgi:hypothetical protein